MRVVNRDAAEQLVVLGDAVHAVTDVTGYGLAGHSWEMAERSGVRVIIDTATLPSYPGAMAAAVAGVRTGGDPRNREYLEGHLISSAAPGPETLCYDPQTSGGLLAAVDPAVAEQLSLRGVGGENLSWTQVGTVGDGHRRSSSVSDQSGVK